MFNVVEVYTKDTCPSCNSLKTLLNGDYKELYNDVKFFTLGEDITIEQLTEILGFQPRCVPQVIVDGQYIGSFRRADAFFRKHIE